MKQKTKTIQRQVNLLRDPEPRFVSLVDHGANQTPFNAVKRAAPQNKPDHTGDRDMPIVRRNSTADEKAQSVEVRKLVFSGEKYATEESVKKWLDTYEWTDFVLAKKGDTFVVEKNGASDSDFTDLRTISVDDGIESVIGKVAVADDGDDEDADPSDGGTTDTKKSEEGDAEPATDNVLKLDWYDLYYSNGATIGDVLKDATTDGLPPGMSDLLQATAKAIGNSLKSQELTLDQKKKSLKSIGSELAQIATGMYEVYDDATSKTVKDVRGNPAIPAFIKKMEDDFEALSNFTMPAPVVAKEDMQKTAENNPEAAQSVAEPDAILKAITGLASKIEAIGKKVDDTATVAKSASDAAKKAVSDVASIASRAPTKKADAGSDGSDGRKTDTKKAEDDEATAFARKGLYAGLGM